jgi:hypothetical protein
MDQLPSIRTLAIMTVLPVAAILWLFGKGEAFAPQACFDSSIVQSLVIHENSNLLVLRACGADTSTSQATALDFDQDFVAQRRVRAAQSAVLELQSLAHRTGIPIPVPPRLLLDGAAESVEGEVTAQWLEQGLSGFSKQSPILKAVLVSLLTRSEAHSRHGDLYLLRENEVLALQNSAWAEWISGKISDELGLGSWAFASDGAHRFLREALSSRELVRGCPTLSQDPGELRATLVECAKQILAWAGHDVAPSDLQRLSLWATRDVDQVFTWDLARLDSDRLYFQNKDRQLSWSLRKLGAAKPRARYMVAEFCGAYPWKQLTAADQMTERVLIVQNCEQTKSNDYAPLMRSGIEMFASLNPDMRFALVHLPSLKTAQKFSRRSGAKNDVSYANKWKRILDQSRGQADSTVAKSLRRHTGVLNVVEYSQGFPELSSEMSTLMSGQLSGHLGLED